MNTIVVEPTEQGDLAVDVYQKLADNRVLFISGDIDDKVAVDIVASLLLKDSENPDEKITLFINSEGGNIRDVLSIYDMMCLVDCPIETICIGSAMDEASIILMAGTPGMRFATKNSIICVSQLVNTWMRMGSDLTEAKTSLDICTSDNKRAMEIVAKCTGKTLKEVMAYFERRVFMTCQQAVKYGVIDKAIASNK